jgi:hypothetical protein
MARLRAKVRETIRHIRLLDAYFSDTFRVVGVLRLIDRTGADFAFNPPQNAGAIFERAGRFLIKEE